MMTDIGQAAETRVDTLRRWNGRHDWLNSLSTRLLLTCTVALAITMTIVSIGVVVVFEHYTSATIGPSHQLRQARELIRGMRMDATGDIVAVTIPEVSGMWYIAFPSEIKYRFLDAAGHVLYASMRDGSLFPVDGPFDPSRSRAEVGVGAQVFSIVTASFRRDGKTFYVQTAVTHHLQQLDARDRFRAIFPIVRTSSILALVIFALAMRSTFIAMFHPLRRVSRDAADISPTNLDARLSLKKVPSEILPLITAFNAVLERLEAGFKRQQAFLETTAHELQTPLTLIRAQLELGRQSGRIDYTELLGDVDHMSRRVRQLLHLAEVSAPHNYHPAPLDIARIAEDVRHYLVDSAQAAKVDIVIQCMSLDDLQREPVLGDEAAFFMLLKNLVENAIKMSPPLSIVTVEVAPDQVAVSDDGAGIAPDHLPHIFERFWRAPNNTADGAGLGLAICREIAAAHDWHLFVDLKVLHTRFVVAFAGPGDLLRDYDQAALRQRSNTNRAIDADEQRVPPTPFR